MQHQSRLAFSLSGGSLGCLAYVSFTQVLRERYGIKPTLLAGLSGGAIVAPLIALEMSFDEAFEIFNHLSFYKIINFHLNHIELVDHAKLISFFRENIPVEKFDQLPVQTLVLVTNVKSQNLEVIDTGDIASAIVASSSVFPLLEPIKRRGKLFSDGGYTTKYGVNVIKNYDIDKIIGIDVIGLSEGNTPRFLKALYYSLNSALKTFADFEAEKYPVDLEIKIDATTPTIFDLAKRKDSLYRLGEQFAIKYAEKIKAL